MPEVSPEKELHLSVAGAECCPLLHLETRGLKRFEADALVRTMLPCETLDIPPQHVADPSALVGEEVSRVPVLLGWATTRATGSSDEADESG
jgi:hypothetical protein